MKKEKLIIIAAPSGSGKTTIVKELLSLEKLNLGFSISLTTRVKRDNEINGKDYHFVSVSDFKEKIRNNDFIEWEEVYKNVYYGTTKSEIKRLNIEEKNIGTNDKFIKYKDRLDHEFNVDWNGWKMVSIKYSDLILAWNSGGNSIREPNKVLKFRTLLLANPESGFAKADVDYIVWSEGSAIINQ